MVGSPLSSLKVPSEASGEVSLLTVLRQDVGMVSDLLAECGKSEAAADLQLLGSAWLQEAFAIHTVIGSLKSEKLCESHHSPCTARGTP